MFRKKIKHTQRYQEILNAFIRNGLSHFLFRMGLTKRAATEMKKDTEIDMNLQDIGVKLRHTLQELGPTFIKLGQIVSSRRDSVPEEITTELEKLQDDVTSFPFEKVREIVEDELGDTLENLFQDFNETPLATASIGQVHVAHLFTGEQVAIKIRRPDIQPTIETDLEILHNLARLMEEKFEWAKKYRLQDMIDEFSSSLRDELDYRVEGRNAERIAKQFTEQPTIHIPNIHWDFSTKIVLTMDMIKGIKVSHINELEEQGYDLKLIAKRLVDSMFHQVLTHGFFHGDPHPGNVYILPDNEIAYLDFGMVGRLSEDLKYHFASLIMSLQQGNSEGMIKTFDDMGLLEDETDMDGLLSDLNDLQSRYYDTSLTEISLGGVITEIFAVAYHHHIQVPSSITILGKAILTLEGIVEKLDPDFSIMNAVEPFGEKLIRQRFHPGNILRSSWKQLVENIEILTSLPKNINEITSTIKKGKLRLDINVPELQVFLQRLDKISNRISFSIILLSFSILMVGLIIGASIAGQTTLLWKLPVIEAGSVVATLMFLFMIFSIGRSGRM